MRFTKFLGVCLFLVAGLFLFVINFSSVTSNYECKGEISYDESKLPKTIYIVTEEFRWWVGLWSDSDGNLKLEIPNEHVNYYSHMVKVGNQLQIYDPPNEMKGNFSTLSKALTLKTTYGYFDGKCSAIQ